VHTEYKPGVNVRELTKLLKGYLSRISVDRELRIRLFEKLVKK